MQTLKTTAMIKEKIVNKFDLLKQKRYVRRLVKSNKINYKDVSSALLHRTLARKVVKHSKFLNENFNNSNIIDLKQKHSKIKLNNNNYLSRKLAAR